MITTSTEQIQPSEVITILLALQMAELLVSSIDLGAGANLNINTEVGGTGAGDIAVNADIKRITAGDGDDALDVTISSGSGTISVEVLIQVLMM